MLDPKRTRSNHTSEARRGERKPLLKLDWREKGLVGRPDCLDPYAFSKGSDKFDYKASDRIKLLDYLSCFLSIIAFVLALWYGNSHPFSIELWDENVLVSPNTTMAVYQNLNASVNSTEVELRSAQLITGLELRSQSVEGFCYEKRSVYNIKRQWNNTVYVGSAIIEPAAWPGTVRPWYLLIWIFLVSIVFQGKRALNNEDSKPIVERYNPLKPDYWRWVEYALTSPFQVFLIATSVMIGERSQLLSLMGLQGALVMIGFANEKRIDKFYKRSLKRLNLIPGASIDRGDPVTWSQAKRGKIRLTMLLSWSFFAIIWYTIIHRFQEQVMNLDDCHYVAEMPKEVRFIVWSQCLLFGLFGLVQSVQVFWTLWKDEKVLKSGSFEKARNGDNEWYGVFLLASIVCFITGIVVDNLFLSVVPVFSAIWAVHGLYTKRTEVTTIATLRQRRWDDVAFRYSFLSVTAKTTLEVGFILLVIARERMTT